MELPVAPELERIRALNLISDFFEGKNLPEPLRKIAPEVLKVTNDAFRYFIKEKNIPFVMAATYLKNSAEYSRPPSPEWIKKANDCIALESSTPPDDTETLMKIQASKDLILETVAYEWVEKIKLAQAEHIRNQLKKNGSDAESPSADSMAIKLTVQNILNQYWQHAGKHYADFLNEYKGNSR